MNRIDPLHAQQNPQVQARPSFPRRVWLKICEVARKIFNFFFFWKKPDYILSERQIAIIDQARLNARQVIPTPPPLPPIHLIPESERVERISPDPNIVDPSLKQLLSTLMQFGSVVTECIKTEKISPSIESLQEDLAKLPDMGKLWVKMCMDVKQYLDPIFERFPNADEPLVMTLIQLLCNVLLENKTQAEIEDALSLKINDLLSKRVISEDLHNRLISAIQPTLSWIIHSNNMLLRSIDPIQLHELLIDTRDFSLQFSTMLLNGELDETIEEIQAIVQENLEESLESLLDDNNQPIARFIGSRITDLIQNIPYTESFDNLADRINSHLDAWIVADAKYKEAKKTIRAARQSLDSFPSNVDQAPKSRLEEYLAIVDDAGGEKEYLSQKFTDDFRESFASKNPDSVELISPPSAGISAEMAEEEVYNAFAEKLYRLLLPSGKNDLPFDIHLEQDGLAQIWEQIELPEKLAEIEHRLLSLFESVLQRIEPRNEDNFKAYFFLILKTVIFYHIRQNKIIPIMSKGIRNIFEKFSNPASINELFSETIMPTVTEKLFELFARQVVSSNLDVFSPLFCNLIEAPGNRVVEAKRIIIARLEEVMERKFYDFNWDMINREDVPTIVQPIIVEITQVLQNLKELDPTKTLQDRQVSEAIKKFYVSEKVETKKEFGEIIMKLLNNIGNFNSSWTGWLISFFKDSLAQVATVGFKDYRSSFHPIVNSIIGAGEKHYLDEDYVKSTFFDDERSLEETQEKEEVIRERLPDQFVAIAAQTHDMLYDGAGGRLTPATETINNTIQRIFKKIFKRNLINKNLVFQFFKVLDTALESSVIRSEANLQLQYRVQLISNN